MNKSLLADAIASEANVTKTDARKMLNAFIKVTGEGLEKGEKITLTGFGTFHTTRRPESVGRNPRTGASIKIPPKTVVKFKPSAELSLLIK